MEGTKLEMLPDDCLTLIFFHLTLKQGVQTSLVSKAWRYLWAYTLCANALNLDKNYFFYREINPQVMERGRSKVEFTNKVDMLLEKIQAIPIVKTFRVRFDLGAKASSNLDIWLSFALDKGVEEIEINLKQADHRIKDVKKYVFPLHLLDNEKAALSLKRFHLASCIFRVMHPTNNGLKNLLSLILDTVEIDQTQIECLVNKYCKHLEWLRLMHIQGVKVLKIDGSSSFLALKYIELKSCPNLSRISISDTTQLHTFEYTGKRLEFSFLNLPKLKNVSLFYKPDQVRRGKSDGLDYVCKHFPLRTQLETFTLSTSAIYFKGPLYPYDFCQLKKLVIMLNASAQAYTMWVLYMIQACPLLEKFEVHFTSTSLDTQRCLIVHPPFEHGHLKEITLTSVRGCPCELELLTGLVFFCRCPLQMVVVDSRKRVYLGNGQWNVLQPYQSFARYKQRWIEDELLKPPLPNEAQLVFLD